MLKYGSEQCLLDATYRTTQYAVPLYFVAVQTNVGFCVVEGVQVLLCFFHRKQAWHRRQSQTDNGIGKEDRE